jgi:hypothetical protein
MQVYENEADGGVLLGGGTGLGVRFHWRVFGNEQGQLVALGTVGEDARRTAAGTAALRF